MSVHTRPAGARNRTSPTGSLRFDRRFPTLGVPRLQHSADTQDVRVFEARNAILTRLARMNNALTLQAFASGEIDIHDLVSFAESENLKGGLGELRMLRRAEREHTRPVSLETRQTCDVHVMAPEPGRVTPATLPRVDANAHIVEQPTVVRDVQVSPFSVAVPSEAFDTPLWDTFLDVTIPGMLHIEEQSRRRYATSITTLRQRLGLYGASEATFKALADINPDHWDALRLARMRGLTVEALRLVTKMSTAEQRLFLRREAPKLGVQPLQDLVDVTPVEWDALASVARFPIDGELVQKMERIKPSDRATLRSLSLRLSPTAPISCLGAVSEGEWHALAKHWGASSSDWMHLRRSLSACISRHLGSDRHLFRQVTIDRIPVQSEVERVPDVSPKKLAEITAYLPAPIRTFAWFIVLSGCRIGEYLRLDREHLRKNAGCIVIPGTKTKGAKREVYVGEAAWWIVDRCVPSYLGYGQLRQHWLAACEQAGVFGVTLHDLRHCSGQFAAEAGVDEATLQAHFGHSTVAQTRKYTKRVKQAAGARVLSDVVMPFAETQRDG